MGEKMVKFVTCQDYQDSYLKDKKTQWKDFVTLTIKESKSTLRMDKTFQHP